jgi:dUTPase
MENQIDEVELMQHITPEVIYQQDKAAIDMQISTAKAFPRNVKRATENALALVTMDVATAEKCTYSVPRGDKPITGPSVHLAKVLAQVWGNMRIEAKVVAIDQSHVTSEAVCFDLENNLAIKTQVKRLILQNEMTWNEEKRKMIRTGKMVRMSEDMVTVTGNAANAIALRNAILSVVPKGVVDKVYNAAKQAITGDISDKTKLIAKRKQVFEGLRDSFNLTEKEILAAIGKAALDHVTGDDLVVLIGVAQSIKDGDTTIEQAFKGVKEGGSTNGVALEDLQKLYEEKLPLLSKTEQESAKRIIENQEKDSYKKLLATLISKSA